MATIGAVETARMSARSAARSGPGVGQVRVEHEQVWVEAGQQLECFRAGRRSADDLVPGVSEQRAEPGALEQRLVDEKHGVPC